jgi:hypothetical protein
VKAVAAAAIAAGCLAWAAGPAVAGKGMGRVEGEAIDSVLRAVEAGDCGLAVRRLNDGLSQQHPWLFLLAGAMYENGTCLKPQWDRAERMYLRAHDAKHPAGRLRLVAGYARGQRDPAAALWWASELGSLPPECRPFAAGTGAGRDPEAFVREIQLWPAAQLRACTYVAGVLAQVLGEAEFPATAALFAMRGRVQMDFKPAAGQIEWKTLELEELQILGVSSGDAQTDRKSRRVRGAFEAHLRQVGERALKEHPRPAGVPEGWAMQTTFTFSYE